ISEEPEAMEVELPQGTTAEQVHVPDDVPVDDDENACMQNTALAEKRPAPETKTPPADSPSLERSNQTNQNPSQDEPEGLRRSKRLSTKPRQRWDSRMHFARASRATTRNIVSDSLEIDPQSLNEAMASPFARKWGLAIEEELTSLEKNKTW